MFATALFVQAILASAALALPSSSERYAKRVAMRNGGVRQSMPKALATNVTQTEYSSNWAGAVWNSAAVSLGWLLCSLAFDRTVVSCPVRLVVWLVISDRCVLTVTHWSVLTYRVRHFHDRIPVHRARDRDSYTRLRFARTVVTA